MKRLRSMKTPRRRNEKDRRIKEDGETVNKGKGNGKRKVKQGKVKIKNGGKNVVNVLTPTL